MDGKIVALTSLKNKEKFIEEGPFYTGVRDENIRSVLNRGLNISIDGFIKALYNNIATKGQFLTSIKDGLSALDAIVDLLDTEDKERVCEYYEEMMDIVELDSSEGILNKWLYGFDPIEGKMS